MATTLNVHLEGVVYRKAVEIWFQDEARIGQKNGIVRMVHPVLDGRQR